MTTTPEDYPAECTIGAEELQELKAYLTDNPDLTAGVEEWPPTDAEDNVYPIFFTKSELTSDGRLTDDNGHAYHPFAGNLEPHRDGSTEYCNAPLTKWQVRYPEIRYCATALYWDADSPYCATHRKTHEQVNMKTADEYLQTGLHSKTVDHVYEALDPYQQLVAWGTYESLMGESTYDYGIEYRQEQIDFSGVEPAKRPADVDEDGILDVRVAYPTQYTDAALALYQAAVMNVQMITVQAKIVHQDRADGEDVMEKRTTQNAQLTAPTENDPNQEWATLEGWVEHHLNLPYSRLIRDRPDLLKRGGIAVDPEAEEDSMDAEEVILEIEADPNGIETTDDTGTDPNAYGDGVKSQSQKIVDAASTDGTDT